MNEILLAKETRQGQYSNYVTEAKLAPNGNIIITEAEENGEIIDCVSISPVFVQTMLDSIGEEFRRKVIERLEGKM